MMASRRAEVDVDEDADDAFEDPEEGEKEVVLPPPVPRAASRRGSAATGTGAEKKADILPEDKFNKCVTDANVENNVFDFYAVDITIEGSPLGTIRGRECRYEHDDGDRDPHPSYAGLSQRVGRMFWDGTTQIFHWSLRNQNGQAVRRGPLPFVANPKRQAQYLAEVAAMRERSARPPVPVVDVHEEERRRRAEEESRREEERRRRRQEEEEEEAAAEERRRRRARSQEEGPAMPPGYALPSGDAYGSQAPMMPRDPYVFQMQRQMDEDRRRLERERDEDRHRREKEKDEEQRKTEERERAHQATLERLTSTLGALTERVMQPVTPPAAVATAPVSPSVVNPFANLPPAPRGHEYMLLDGQPVLRPVQAPASPQENDDADEYTGAFRQMRKMKNLAEQLPRFFGDSGKADGGTSTSEAPPAKRTFEEIPDGEGGAAWRVVIDPDTGLPSRDVGDIANVNGDILIREGKKLIATAFDAWKASKEGAPRPPQMTEKADRSLLDKD